jgi:hypothetical protein
MARVVPAYAQTRGEGRVFRGRSVRDWAWVGWSVGAVRCDLCGRWGVRGSRGLLFHVKQGVVDEVFGGIFVVARGCCFT